MRVVVDIEANGLTPDTIHCIVIKDIDTERTTIFGPRDLESFKAFSHKVRLWIGHNIIGYDIPVLNSLLGLDIDYTDCIDTLVVSRLVDFLARDSKHSILAWGKFFGIAKKHAKEDANFFLSWSQELQDRCASDVEINYRVFRYLEKYIYSPVWRRALRIEHELSYKTLQLHKNGFGFNLEKAKNLRQELILKLEYLDKIISLSFLPKLVLIREISPRETQHGTLNRSDFRWVPDGDLSGYSAGAPFSLCKWEAFNAASPSQIVSRLNEAGWRPTERTKGYQLAVRARDKEKVKKYHDTNTGWRVCEENLSTLPESAPEGARKLAERIRIASRISDLDEWINLAREVPGSFERYKVREYRIHGHFSGIGAWTGRMSHSKPNTANIPTRKPQDTVEIATLNDTLRTLWVAGKGRCLVGVDADQIQLRVLAHYMQDDTFTKALVEGNKEIGTDVHSLNVKAIGPVCKGRRDAKTFIYSWLLGAGIGRVAEILGSSLGDAKQAREDFVGYYPGLKRLKSVDIARDARNGYFKGLDGRYVVCYGEDEDQRNHYMLGGYLQNGEKVVMEYALDHWSRILDKEKIPYWLVNFVHDEWQIETVDDRDTALYISRVVSESIGWAGTELGTICPMKGSMMSGHNEKEYAIGYDWLHTH